MASQSSARSRPQKEITPGFQAIPTSPADVTTTDTTIYQIVVGNPTAGAIALVIKDIDTTVHTPISISVAANTTLVIPFPEGVFFKGGLNWDTDGAGLVADVYGFYKTTV